MASRSPLRQATLFAMAMPLAGCCLFCGPDRSEWISEDFSDPMAAIRTFREAVGRDNVTVIYRALSPAYRQRHGIPGGFEAAVAWERLKREAKHVHLLGRADISEPEWLSPTRVRFVLTVHGRAVRVDLTRTTKVGIRYLIDGETKPQEVSRFVDHVDLDLGALSTEVVLRLPGFPLLPVDLEPDDIVAVFGEHFWAVDDIGDPTDDSVELLEIEG